MTEKQIETILNLCKSKYKTCPFGCAKDGSLNCSYNIRNIDCQPAKDYISQNPTLFCRVFNLP
jgi:hypothetical protein